MFLQLQLSITVPNVGRGTPLLPQLGFGTSPPVVTVLVDFL
jgi:hypothetical protein